MAFLGNDHMNIYGFDKTSLLNYPEHVAATIFTGGCNMRCPYCHNGELVLNPPVELKIAEDEVLAHLKKRSNVLTGLCITGGEPTLQPDLKSFIAKVRALGYRIKLDTNGLKPDTLSELIDDGMLDYVAMDIKAGRVNYPKVAGTGPDAVDNVTESIKKIIASNTVYEFRTTVVKGLHSSEDFEDIRDWLRQLTDEVDNGSRIKNYYLQSYVYRDTILNPSGEYDSFNKEELERFAEIISPVAENVSIRGLD